MSKHEQVTQFEDVGGRDAARPGADIGAHDRRPRNQTGRARLFWIGMLVLLLGALALGTYQHFALHAQVIATAKEHDEFVPNVRVAPVRASLPTWPVTLPGTTSAFATANIFARATGYISRRQVDIGDHVTKGQLLAEITAPELDHQISQAEATLAQLKAALQQAQANRDLGSVTWGRDKPLVDKGWVTPQQGDTDRLNLAAQDAAVAVAQANIKQQEAQLQVLHQQKDYQSVVAPFDGVVTQRNVDIGDLVQADATSGTFMFTVMQTDVIRIQVYVPQDAAFGVAPGVAVGVRVPEIPDRVFPGTVTRLATALQPGSRTLLTEIDVPNPDHALTAGS
jgi:RND family efflux transporter MFP subunit